MIFSDIAEGWGYEQMIDPLFRCKLFIYNELKQVEAGGIEPSTCNAGQRLTSYCDGIVAVFPWGLGPDK